MARPIKDTPTLTGKDAKRFLDQIKKSEANRPSESELKEMRESFKILESITQIPHVIPKRTNS